MTTAPAENTIVLSLGGSLIVPHEVNGVFVRALGDLLGEQHRRSGKRFMVICGGGKTARRYQEGLRQAGIETSEDLDYVGIDASVLNARFVQRVFGHLAASHLLTNPTVQQSFSAPVIVGAGWKPGHSTDVVAVQCAVTHRLSTVINLSNITAVYDKDPQQFADAVARKVMSWDELLQLVGATWEPGMNTPFDPVAARLACEHGVRVIVASGTNLANLEALLDEKSFEGTVIS